MDYEKFCTRFQQMMQNRIGDRGEISLVKVNKINIGETDSLLLRMEDRNASPAVRLRPCWDLFRKGVSLEKLADDIEDLFLEEAPRELPGFDPSDYEMCRERIYMRLINTAQNCLLLSSRAHREFKDLSVIYQLHLDDEGNYSTAVTCQLMEIWQVTEEQLFQQARLNMRRDGGYQLIPMEQMLFNLGAGQLASPEQPDPIGLWILTAPDARYGAVQLLNETALQQAARIFDGDFWILPSSIHELILTEASSDRRRGELENMVQEINRTQVDPEEVLSDRVYYYDSRSGLIC